MPPLAACSLAPVHSCCRPPPPALGCAHRARARTHRARHRTSFACGTDAAVPLRFGKNGPRASLLGCSATGYGIVVAIVLVVGAPCAFIGGTLCSPVLHSTVARRCNMSASDADLDKPAHAVVIHISAHNTHTARACTRALAERACKTIASCFENMAGLCVCSVIYVAMFACETIARSPHTAPPHRRTLRYCRRLPQCGARPPVPQRPSALTGVQGG